MRRCRCGRTARNADAARRGGRLLRRHRRRRARHHVRILPSRQPRAHRRRHRLGSRGRTARKRAGHSARQHIWRRHGRHVRTRGAQDRMGPPSLGGRGPAAPACPHGGRRHGRCRHRGGHRLDETRSVSRDSPSVRRCDGRCGSRMGGGLLARDARQTTASPAAHDDVPHGRRPFARADGRAAPTDGRGRRLAANTSCHGSRARHITRCCRGCTTPT